MTTTTSAKPLIDPIALLITCVAGFAVMMPTVCILGAVLVVGAAGIREKSAFNSWLIIIAIVSLVIALEAVVAAASYGFFYKRRHGEVSTSKSMIGGAVAINLLTIFADVFWVQSLPTFLFNSEDSGTLMNTITVLATFIGVLVVSHVVAGVLGVIGGVISSEMIGRPLPPEPEN